MQPKRKSQRKQGYDYSQPGHYAVTVCTQNRSCLFGVIDNGDMLLNEAGRMIDETWCEMPDHCPGITFDVMQIMPNHLHGIIIVRVGEGPCALPAVPCVPEFGRRRPNLCVIAAVGFQRSAIWNAVRAGSIDTSLVFGMTSRYVELFHRQVISFILRVLGDLK